MSSRYCHIGSSLRVLSSFGSSRARDLSLVSHPLEGFLCSGLCFFASVVATGAAKGVATGLSDADVEEAMGTAFEGAVRYPSREIVFPPIVIAFESVLFLVFLFFAGGGPELSVAMVQGEKLATVEIFTWIQCR